MQLMVAVFLLVCQTAIANNIILNPGFEASPQLPSNWIINGGMASMRPVISIDNRNRFAGSFALKMESTNPNAQGRAVQRVPVSGGLSYLFNARFLPKNVRSIDKSVMIKITWYKGEENVGYQYIYDIADNTNGWFLASGKVKAIEGATTAEIVLAFRWSQGTVWWDDISLDTCSETPAREVKVGTVYCRPPGPTVEKNIAVMGKLLDDAGTSGCRIVCLPEGWATSNTGLSMKKVEANTLEGSASRMMAQKAKQYGMYIVSGLYSWVGDTLNNVAVLYDRQGKIQAVYKKVELPDNETEEGAVPGNALPVFTTDFGTIGMLVCWDYAFPEVSRALAIKGAEILFCPIAGDLRGTDGYKVISRSRAIDNGVYFVNSIYDGHSMIINPAGDILQETGTQGTLITATIDLNYNPPWNWLGNVGRGVWKGVWRKDRRSDLFGVLGDYSTSD